MIALAFAFTLVATHVRAAAPTDEVLQNVPECSSGTCPTDVPDQANFVQVNTGKVERQQQTVEATSKLNANVDLDIKLSCLPRETSTNVDANFASPTEEDCKYRCKNTAWCQSYKFAAPSGGICKLYDCKQEALVVSMTESTRAILRTVRNQGFMMWVVQEYLSGDADPDWPVLSVFAMSCFLLSGILFSLCIFVACLRKISWVWRVTRFSLPRKTKSQHDLVLQMIWRRSGHTEIQLECVTLGGDILCKFSCNTADRIGSVYDRIRDDILKQERQHCDQTNVRIVMPDGRLLDEADHSDTIDEWLGQAPSWYKSCGQLSIKLYLWPWRQLFFWGAGSMIALISIFLCLYDLYVLWVLVRKTS